MRLTNTQRNLSVAFDREHGRIMIDLPSQYPNPPNFQFTDCEMAWILSGTPSDPFHDNAFFESQMYVPGIALLAGGRTGNPHEHLAEYERVLDQVRRVAPNRFPGMHKGTPYYVMGWLAYKIRDFERCAFYMDAALAEDIKNNPNWDKTPAAAFMFLDPTHPDAAAQEIVGEARAEVDAQVSRYSLSVGSPFSTQVMIDRFVRPHANVAPHRSIVTAMLTFMLEAKDRLMQIDIRSIGGGTLEPFLTHLFKGGLIYESILKGLYLGTLGGSATLGNYLSNGTVRNDIGIAIHNPLYDQHPKPRTFPDLIAALPSWAAAPVLERAVAITYTTRNTSGHDLAWPATLDRATYAKIHEGILDAIFGVMDRKY